MKDIPTFLHLLILVLLSTSLTAQGPEPCQTTQYHDWKQQQDPDYIHGIAQAESKAAQWLRNHPEQVGRQVLTIPVVVHVVYKNGIENLSDARIMSEIDVLNADFRRLNADTLLTRPEFDSLGSDMEINFCLANVDPDGNPTNGITRTSTTGGTLAGYFGLFDDVKQSSTGGKDPWPTDQYLNIWVCPLFPIYAGYSQFPGGDSATDGIVVAYQVFGTIGNLAPDFDKGRTTVHEIGHWLGLRHIWGDGDCFFDDFVDDTPKASGPNTGNCLTITNTCVDSIFDYDDMVENFMDYSLERCMNLFTEGQKARAWSFLNTDRTALFTSAGCSGVAAEVSDDGPEGIFDLFPVPSTGNVWLESRLTDLTATHIEVFDLRGQIIFEKVVQMSQKRVALELNDLESGAYFVRVSAGGQQQVRKLLIGR